MATDLKPGDSIPELRVTPDKYLPYRYAGASGDFNPIHIDPEFARQVGLPGNILHGLWSMAQVARAQTEAAGGPDRLRRLSVQSMPNSPAIAAKPARQRSRAGAPASALGSKATRMKNMPPAASLNCCASLMLPPRVAR